MRLLGQPIVNDKTEQYFIAYTDSDLYYNYGARISVILHISLESLSDSSHNIVDTSNWRKYNFFYPNKFGKGRKKYLKLIKLIEYR